ncbi:MFS transporter, metabolite:H+ symporter [Blastomyces gilchristii SLH14081]|uniref:MFS transporter, metabolite:H+ symporter n=1 Tax=Blastomyces gilchristii (strain SLH14081) TaxID=559298 RepID=A0A179UVP3_BLAGS|nr:MFS transporter, metabolite:H+ symporter [Blastomyces gilchristii SLH14081]OAT12186.1 MFS transporter, metabolite:H+ symporter [Blastomyces gilchristii SLH14081]
MESRAEGSSELIDKASYESPNKNLPAPGSQEVTLQDAHLPSLTTATLPSGSADPIYEAKAQLLNQAILDIGMGWYQWQLFIVIGFGWASDNLWPIVTSLIFTPVTNEFSPSRPPLLTLAQNLGLLVGAVFWGFGCDIYGRRWAFNLTIGITAVFGLVAAGSPNFAAIAVFAALWSVGVGGNLPVDSAIFLEFLPSTHQFLLTVLSIDWALAQVVANLIAWPLLGNLTCQEGDETCSRGENMGWRYFMITVGGISMLMFFIRFACFTIFESPKYLMGKGRDEDAVRVVHEVARRNGKTSSLTLEALTALGHGTTQRSGAGIALQRNLEKLDSNHVKSLFATPKLAWSTSLIILIWAFIGLGFPLYNAFLPYIQATRGANFGDGSTYITYRNSLIIAVLGVPGCLLGGALVELPRLGRKGTLSLSMMFTGVFLFASTTAESSNALLGWNCAYSFMSNIMYAVLYAYTPEIFLTKDRGTGNALTAAANRVFGVMAPIIALFADLETAVPVYVSGVLFIVASVLVMLLPFESRGKASL